jgi:hypothetical protein
MAMAMALFVAGCGGNDENDTTAALTKAQFLKRGNAICAAGGKEIDQGFKAFNEDEHLKANQEPTDAEAEEIADTILLPAVQKQVDELRELGAPEGDEEQVEEILDGADEAIEEGEEDPSALVTENGGVFAEVNKMAREYGLTVCGEE